MSEAWPSPPTSTPEPARWPQHQDGQRVQMRCDQFLDAADDGAGLAGAQLDHGQDRKVVGRDIEDGAGDQESPGAADTSGLRSCRAEPQRGQCG